VKCCFDEAWHRRSLAGDGEAVAALAFHTLEPLYRFCFYRVGGRRDLCEDVVQETMLQAIRELESYEPGRADNNIFPWITGLARNAIRRSLAQRAGGHSLDGLWARVDEELLRFYCRFDEDPFDNPLLDREETRHMVSATMSQLPDRYRQALEAKYFKGESVRDIAGARGESEKAVESLLTRARAAFRETFLTLTRNLALDLEG